MVKKSILYIMTAAMVVLCVFSFEIGRATAPKAELPREEPPAQTEEAVQSTEPVETEPVKTEPVETKPVETEPAPEKPVHTYVEYPDLKGWGKVVSINDNWLIEVETFDACEISIRNKRIGIYITDDTPIFHDEIPKEKEKIEVGTKIKFYGHYIYNPEIAVTLPKVEAVQIEIYTY